MTKTIESAAASAASSDVPLNQPNSRRKKKDPRQSKSPDKPLIIEAIPKTPPTSNKQRLSLKDNELVGHANEEKVQDDDDYDDEAVDPHQNHQQDSRSVASLDKTNKRTGKTDALLTGKTKFSKRKISRSKSDRSTSSRKREETVAQIQKAIRETPPKAPPAELLQKMNDPNVKVEIDDMVVYKQFLQAKYKELSRQKMLTKIRLKALSSLEVPNDVDQATNTDGADGRQDTGSNGVSTIPVGSEPSPNAAGGKQANSVATVASINESAFDNDTATQKSVPFSETGYSIDGLESTTHRTDNSYTAGASTATGLSLNDKEVLIEQQRMEIAFLRSKLQKTVPSGTLSPTQRSHGGTIDGMDSTIEDDGYDTGNNNTEDDGGAALADGSSGRGGGMAAGNQRRMGPGFGVPTVIDEDTETVTSMITSNTGVSAGAGSTSGNLGFIPPCYWAEEMPWRLEAPMEHLMGSYTGNVSRDFNVPYGRGKMHFSNGDVYDGPFRHGELHGPNGTYVWSDGARYQGGFWHNLQHGKGHFRSSRHADDYYEYVGNYRYNERHGTGIQYNIDATIFHNGLWQHNKPVQGLDYAVAVDDDDRHYAEETSQYYESESDRSIYDSGDDYDDLASVGFTPTLVKDASARSFQLTTPTIVEED